MKWRWLLIGLPLLAGLIFSAVLYQFSQLNPIIYMRMSLSMLLVWLGGFFSLLLLLWMAWRYWQHQQQLARTHLQEQAGEDRRRFLQRLDHELKNPLMAIRAALANAGAATPPVQQAVFTSMEAQTVRLSRLTADLRKIAELEHRPLECTAIDLTALLAEAVQIMQDSEGGDRQITLNVPQAPWPLPEIAGDWDLLFLAIYNLLENACKFTDKTDTIEVRAREDGRFVLIEVADTGPGINIEEVPHVWEELYRGEGAHGVPGSGLGLALVKAIVERHGGTVTLHSRVNQGTAVALHLPNKSC